MRVVPTGPEPEGVPCDEEPCMLSMRSKTEQYLERRRLLKVEKNRLVLWLGWSWSNLCITAWIVVDGLGLLHTTRYALLVAAQLGFCVMLGSDYDVNSIVEEHPAFMRGGAVFGALVPALILAVHLARSGGRDLSSLSWRAGVLCCGGVVNVWAAVRAPDIAKMHRGDLPLPSECVTLWQAFVVAVLALLQLSLLTGHGALGATPHAAHPEVHALFLSIAVLELAFLCWLLVARHPRLGRAGPGGGWAQTGPTARLVVGLCAVGVGGALWEVVETLLLSEGERVAARGGGGAEEYRDDLPRQLAQLLLFTAPPLLAYRYRGVVFGACAKLFEREHRLRDGTFIASLLAGARVRVGDTYYVPSAVFSAVAGSQAVRTGAGDTYYDEGMGTGEGEGVATRWYGGVVDSVEVDRFVVSFPAGSAMPPAASRARRVVVPAAAASMPAAELFRCACASLYQVRASEVGKGEMLAVDASARLGLPPILSKTSLPTPLSASLLRQACRPGQTDIFVLHSWHDERRGRLEALARCAARFEAQHGREPTLWLDSVCVDPAFQEEALLCLPIYMQSCASVLVLCGPSFFERLWCVWELYTAFAFGDGSLSLAFALLRAPGAAEEQQQQQQQQQQSSPPAVGRSASAEVARASLRASLKAFSLARAHCSNPNEEKRLRTAINAAPGGTSAFEATIRGLAERLTEASAGIGDVDLRDQCIVISPLLATTRTPPLHQRALVSRPNITDSVMF